METTYTITEDDYAGAMKLFHKITPGKATVYAIVTMALILTAFSGLEIISAGASGGLIGIFLLLVPGRLIAMPFLAKRQYRKYKAIQEPVTVQLTDEGVNFTTADGGGIIRWEKLLKWRQNEKYILIYPMPKLFHIIPVRVADSGFDIQALVKLLESRVGKKA
ncbi:MAG: YcxB family protein [Candidatus Sabulitectum sp.]|nr:YcxB family protein [Candidatus Sabulitectum sp.]